MTDVLVNSVLASVAGGILGLDRTAAFQTMASRPLVTAPVVGWLVGSLEAGLVAGVILELLLMGDLPVGAYVPPHETFIAAAAGAVVATVVASPAGTAAAERLGAGDAAVAALATPVVILVMLPVGLLYKRVDVAVRRFNSRFYRAAEAAVESGEPVNLVAQNLKGVGAAFVAGVAALFVTVLPVSAAASYLAGGPGPVPDLLYPAFAGCVVVGIGAGVRAAWNGPVSILIYSAAAAAAAVIMVTVL